MKKLIILGNGFDLNLKLPSKYSDFANWLSKDSKELYEQIFPLDQEEDTLWSNLEQSLGEIQIEDVIDYTSSAGSYNDYGSDDWSDADHHWHSQVMEPVYRIAEEFHKYLNEVIIPELENSSSVIESQIKKDVDVINFNYTPTIKKYGVEESNIQYIHGKHSDEQIVFGHDSLVVINEIIEIEKWWNKEYDEFGSVDVDPRIVEMHSELKAFLESKVKKHKENFMKLNCDWESYDQVIVLGHSCADVDKMYFKFLAENLSEIEWIFSYRSENDVLRINTLCNELGIKNKILISCINNVIKTYL